MRLRITLSLPFYPHFQHARHAKSLTATEPIEYKVLCTKDLEKEDIEHFAEAVKRDFFVRTLILVVFAWSNVC